MNNETPVGRSLFEFDEIWSKRQSHIPGLLSLLVHVSVIFVFIVLSAISYNKSKLETLNSAFLDPVTLSLPPDFKSGGGGGGERAPTPASRGLLPKAADVQFVPPTPFVSIIPPELAETPTIIAPELAGIFRATDLMHMGDPNGVIGPPSGGPGANAGIGDGTDHGVGKNKGPSGPGNNTGPGVDNKEKPVRIGVGGATSPSCPLPASEPNYTDDARKARVQGTVKLDVIVNKDGTVTVSKVTQRIGYGLDDEASKFVAKSFRCQPGIYQGQPVSTPVQIDVNFRLF